MYDSTPLTVTGKSWGDSFCHGVKNPILTPFARRFDPTEALQICPVLLKRLGPGRGVLDSESGFRVPESFQ
jgi:hypothetical protein